MLILNSWYNQNLETEILKIISILQRHLSTHD